jgi:hypothetical protein
MLAEPVASSNALEFILGVAQSTNGLRTSFETLAQLAISFFSNAAASRGVEPIGSARNPMMRSFAPGSCVALTSSACRRSIIAVGVRAGTARNCHS